MSSNKGKFELSSSKKIRQLIDCKPDLSLSSSKQVPTNKRFEYESVRAFSGPIDQ